MRHAEINTHQNGGAGGFLRCVGQAISLKNETGKLGVKKRAESALFAERSSSDFWRTASAVRGVEVDSTTRNDGRDGMFVDHLGNSVAQQHNILVKRFDLALELDAIDQINGHGHVFAAQYVQKWVLQQLAFVL